LYKIIFGPDSTLQKLLNWQLKSKGFMRMDDGTILMYKTDGGRCSGDMNTAMGNIEIMCGAVYAFLRAYGMLKRVRVLDAGDDCVLIGEASDMQFLETQLGPWFLQLGLIMKVEPLVYTLERVSFCQTQPVYDGLSWRMVRDPRVTLTKDVTVLHQRQVTDLSNQLSAIGDCGLSLTAGLPVLQEFYVALGAGKGRHGPIDPTLVESGFFQLARGMHGRYRLVTDAARVSFCRAFGIVPDLQLALEEHYRSLAGKPITSFSDGEVERVDLGIGVIVDN
jgi:hypothetical protein